MNETAIAAFRYKLESLEHERDDLQRRLTLALGQVETYKARAIEEADRRRSAENKLDELFPPLPPIVSAGDT